MWPFSKKWSAPAPQLAMIVSAVNQELPSLMMLANPAGAEGAVPGMAGPAGGKPTAENMTAPLQAGEYFAISPGGGGCSVRVERIEDQSHKLSLDPSTLEASGLTEEMLAKFNQPAWRVILQMQTPGNDIREMVVFVARLAQRLAALSDGIVMDASAYRFFGPTGWPVDNPLPEFDAREHVHIHIESDSHWFHTHGLIKFGRPEMEMYDVPAGLEETAYATLFDIAQYVITSALIEPGQTCGDPTQPFYAREGSKNREGHWESVSVLELVDLDARGKPVSSGAPKALQLAASEQGSAAS